MNTLNTNTENIKVEVSKDGTQQLCKGIMLADYCRGIMLADYCRGIMLADYCRGIMLAD